MKMKPQTNRCYFHVCRITARTFYCEVHTKRRWCHLMSYTTQILLLFLRVKILLKYLQSGDLQSGEVESIVVESQIQSWIFYNSIHS